MANHPAMAPGNVAVITGGADGIGLAAARYYQSLGMRVCIADIDSAKLQAAESELGPVLAVSTDVSNFSDLEALREQVYGSWGQVNILMNNAGIGGQCGSWEGYDIWKRILNVNLWGVVNGVHAFAPAMIEQGTPDLIINTGSKQGITTPPGNPAYNASKSAVKSITEALEHDLRNTEGCQVSAHLLVPGFTYTGLVREFLPEKPDSAWVPDQVVAFMVESLERGDFYILCPDNDVTREMDNKRIAWAMGDLIENRPALSRWHPDYLAAFEAFMKS
ncbi:MAG: SDR family NAD(P)-dependent oxidoreductase [Halioglobus sp.]|jgi:NAD(P)-dependent dehydrogenase (short-subunit alcohol dehydrogenase family)